MPTRSRYWRVLDGGVSAWCTGGDSASPSCAGHRETGAALRSNTSGSHGQTGMGAITLLARCRLGLPVISILRECLCRFNSQRAAYPQSLGAPSAHSRRLTSDALGTQRPGPLLSRKQPQKGFCSRCDRSPRQASSLSSAPPTGWEKSATKEARKSSSLRERPNLIFCASRARMLAITIWELRISCGNFNRTTRLSASIFSTRRRILSSLT